MKQCPKCKGSGQVVKYILHYEPRCPLCREGKEHFIQCPDCNGTGYINDKK